MDFKDYIKEIKKTESSSSSNEVRATNKIRLLHAIMGLVTEAGELMDALKRHVYYGEELDYVNIVEELGDISYYMGMAIDDVGVDLDYVINKNISKLRKRYNGEFSKDKALNRDLEAERKLLMEDDNESMG